jgi:hypothetical protein
VTEFWDKKEYETWQVGYPTYRQLYRVCGIFHPLLCKAPPYVSTEECSAWKVFVGGDKPCVTGKCNLLPLEKSEFLLVLPKSSFKVTELLPSNERRDTLYRNFTCH